MKIAELITIRDEISTLLLAKAYGNYQAEADLAVMASRQLEQMTCMGGSTRSRGEAEIVRLVKRFDDTRDSGFGPWPVREVKRLADWRLRTDHRELLEPGREKDRDRLLKSIRAELSAATPWPTVDDVFAWSGTDLGGRQFNMLDHAFAPDEGLSCSSQYGLCE